MPEGPSIVILKEAARPFEGRTIERVEGNTSIANHPRRPLPTAAAAASEPTPTRGPAARPARFCPCLD